MGKRKKLVEFISFWVFFFAHDLFLNFRKGIEFIVKRSNLEYVLVKFFCPNKSDTKFIN